MKVHINKVPQETEELAELYIHKEDEALKRLADYIKQDLYRSISLKCEKGDQICLVQSHRIYYIETIKEKQYLYTEKEALEIKKRLYELERILPSNFIRISKSVIINIDMVQTYTPGFNGLMKVTMNNSAVTYISRKYLKEVRDRILEVNNYE